MKYEIGTVVKDEDGHQGIVSICWDDGDICTIENDAAHPGPKITAGICPLIGCVCERFEEQVGDLACPECNGARLPWNEHP